MFIAAAAERTRHIRLGTGVASLPYHNPFILADRMVQLDHMTRGRAMFGVGPGALVHDALKIGIKAADQRRMMNESLDVIVRLLRGESVTEKTDWYNLVDAQLQLPCYTQPIMEMAVAASRSPAGALASGRHGIGMLSIGGTSPEAMAKHTQNWGLYEEQARLNGLRAGSQQVARGDADARGGDAREGAGEREVRAATRSATTSPMWRRSRSCRATSRTPTRSWWRAARHASARRMTRSPISRIC